MNIIEAMEFARQMELLKNELQQPLEDLNSSSDILDNLFDIFKE